MTDVVLKDLDSGVLTLSFNRPERNNAWNMEMEETFFASLIDAAADPEVRVIVVTGTGRTFCPGMDTDSLAESVAGIRPDRGLRAPMTLARQIPKPIIAAINGACAGIGLIQACSADMRFAAKRAKITTAFARRGLPAENMISWALPRIVGTGVAMDLLLSSRVITGEEAQELGLINRAYELDELMPATLDYAKDIAANCSPASLETIKQQVLTDWERGAEDTRIRSKMLISRFSRSADFGEGVTSFREKRPAHFEGISRIVEPVREPD